MLAVVEKMVLVERRNYLISVLLFFYPNGIEFPVSSRKISSNTFVELKLLRGIDYSISKDN